jgi:HTH-type transcriptional regulator / antitoxin HipB
MFPIGIMASPVLVTTPGELGAAFQAARIARGLRLEDLALAAGVGRRFLGELERGKPTARLAETLRVAEALGVSIMINDPHA